MISEIKNALRFFRISWEYNLINFIAYRIQSVFWVIYNTFLTITTFITISVVYYVSSGIAGWSYYDLMFLAATMNISISILGNLLNVGYLGTQLLKGGVDPYLVKPFGLATLFLSIYGTPSQFAGIISGVILAVYAGSHIHFTLASAAGYAILMAIGTIALILFTLMVVVLAYVLIKGSFFVNKLLNFEQTLSKYPLHVYGLGGQLVFSLLIPIGFAYYYPTKVLLGSYNVYLFGLLCAVGIAIAVISYKSFYVLMRRYTSAGG
ncbi:MAG TPA: ABC-2 family transporter protein [Candidatus Acidoferrales bacterium]|nr:ABC-2 family transporter protein [Candidatus Acidoferrales bacterium]